MTIDQTELESKIEQLLKDILLAESQLEQTDLYSVIPGKREASGLRDGSIETQLDAKDTGERWKPFIEEKGKKDKNDADRGRLVTQSLCTMLVDAYGIAKEDIEILAMFGAAFYYHTQRTDFTMMLPPHMRIYNRAKAGIDMLDLIGSTELIQIYSNTIIAQQHIKGYYNVMIPDTFGLNRRRFDVMKEMRGVQGLFTACVYSLLDVIIYRMGVKGGEPETAETIGTSNEQRIETVDRFAKWQLKYAINSLIEIYRKLTEHHPSLRTYIDSKSTTPP